MLPPTQEGFYDRITRSPNRVSDAPKDEANLRGAVERVIDNPAWAARFAAEAQVHAKGRLGSIGIAGQRRKICRNLLHG